MADHMQQPLVNSTGPDDLFYDPGAAEIYTSYRREDTDSGLYTVKSEIRLYKLRFLIVFLYFFLMFNGGFMQNSFAPVQNIAIKTFHRTTLQINMLALINPIFAIPFSFVSGFLFQRQGLRRGLVIVSLFYLAGSWVRYWGALRNDYWIVLVGQGLFSIGSPFGLAASTLLSESWFSEEGRAIATAVGGLAPIIGSVGASIVAPTMFDGDHAPPQSNRRGFQNLMFLEALMVSAATLGILTCTRDRPPTPPSTSAQHEQDRRDQPSMSLAQMLGTAGSSLQFLLLFVGFGCGYGAINAITTLINQVLHPLGYTDNQIGNIGAALGTGVVGSIVVGVLTDITKQHVRIVKVLGICAGASFLWFFFTLFSDPGTPKPAMAFASLACLGFVGVPIVPVVLEMGVEVLYPLPEGVSTGLLWLAGNGFGLVAVLIADVLQESCSGPPPKPDDTCVRPEKAMYNAMLFLLCMFGGAVLCIVLFRGEMKRMKMEQRHRVVASSNSFEAQPVV